MEEDYCYAFVYLVPLALTHRRVVKIISARLIILHICDGETQGFQSQYWIKLNEIQYRSIMLVASKSRGS